LSAYRNLHPRLLATLLLGSLLSSTTLADIVNDRGQSISLKQAASQAQKLYGGEVISVKSRGDHYRIKLLKDGRVRSVRIPPDGQSKHPPQKTKGNHAR
jgi:hypothetical protein